MSMIPVASLRPNDRNPRTITPAALAKLSKSIERDPTFMELRPIIVDADGVILGGNQRFAACKVLGMTELPSSWVRTAEGLTDAQRARFVIVDNAPEGMAGEWDLDALLADWQVPDLGDLGFDMADLAARLPTGEEVDAEPQTDRADELRQEWGVDAGQLWALGDHRMLCGDSTKAEDVSRLMAGAKADLLLTDPPYGIDYGRAGGFSASHGWGKWRENVEWDKERPSRETIESAISLAAEAIIWGGNYFTDYLPPSMGWLVWDKGQREFSLADCELAWRSERKAARVLTLSRAKALQDGKQHPTQKPVGLMSWCIEQANKSKTIYDPFLGSGTTLIAAEQLGRKCYGLEISPAYCAVVLQRFKDATGKVPTLVAP